MSSITTPRSPAFEEYRQQVDTLTNQIRSQLSQVSAHQAASSPRESCINLLFLSFWNR